MGNKKIKYELIKIKERLDQLECEHILRNRIFTTPDYMFYNQICSSCGKTIESYATLQDYTKANNKWKRSMLELFNLPIFY